MQIGEVAAASTRHQDFLSGLVGMVKYYDVTVALAGFNGAHQTGCTGTDNDNIGLFHYSALLNEILQHDTSIAYSIDRA